MRAARLLKRTVIAIEGEDAIGFANDLTTNDLSRASEGSCDLGAQTTGFLTAQGSLQQLCLAVRTQRGLLLECDRARLDAFAEMLWKARLGRAVSFRWRKELGVISLFPESPQEQTDKEMEMDLEALAVMPRKQEKQQDEKQDEKQNEEQNEEEDKAERLFADPRKPLAATRLWHNNAEGLPPALDALEPCRWVEESVYDSYRLSLSIVERAEEWEAALSKHALPFAFGLDALGAMDWHKACYVGQEIAARLKYRARAPKRHALSVLVRGRGGAVRAGDKMFAEKKEGGETPCGEVLYCVATEQQTILLVLFELAPLRLRRGDELIVVCASGERLRGELLLPRWLAGLWEEQKQETQQGKKNA